MYAKICGIKDIKTLKFIISHDNPPKFIGFIFNYPKSRRNLNIEQLKKISLLNKKKGINFVIILVEPDDRILNKIHKLKFDYFQLYNVSPDRTKFIKRKYKKKIISAITVKNIADVKKYKYFKNIADKILFDSKGYEKSLGFNHELLKIVPNNITKMIAGNIKYDDNLDKLKKISDIIDISGSLETRGKKNTKKINVFLNNVAKI